VDVCRRQLQSEKTKPYFKTTSVSPPTPIPVAYQRLNCLSVYMNFGTATLYENLSSKPAFHEDQRSGSSSALQFGTAFLHVMPCSNYELCTNLYGERH
jgi:hypothetical protein